MMITMRWIVQGFGCLSLFFCFGSCIHKQSEEQNFLAGKSYYFTNAGNDTNEGSSAGPFKSIDKLNNLQLKPGDTVFFEGGQIFNGNILIDSNDAGKKDKPVIITSYGNGKAIINGGAATALTIYQAQYINIINLGFEGSGRKSGNTKDGVIINLSSNINIDSIDIKGFQKAGLQVYKSNVIDIKKVYAAENGFSGINVSGATAKNDCNNIHISYCTTENNPGDPTNFTNHSGNGILAGFCKNVTIEYCTATNNGWDMPRKGNGPVGIWCYEADSIIIQHCISYKNRTSPGAADGGGFDLDGGVTNSVIQYCLSYENEGSGFGIFQYAGASNWYNNTIRYCISENDGSVSPAHAGVFIWNSSDDTTQFRDCFFYNNTVYNTKGAAISYEAQSLNAGFCFYNNIFIGRDSLVIGKETSSTYLGNNWYSLKDGFNINGFKNFTEWANTNNKEKLNETVVGFNINPLFVKGGNGRPVIPSQLHLFTEYLLPDNSILRISGLNLRDQWGIMTGGKAFNQNAAPDKGVGACF